MRIQELELTNNLTAGSASPGLLTTRPVTAMKTINSQIAPFLLSAASNWRKKKKELPLSFDEKFSRLPLHCYSDSPASWALLRGKYDVDGFLSPLCWEECDCFFLLVLGSTWGYFYIFFLHFLHLILSTHSYNSPLHPHLWYHFFFFLLPLGLSPTQAVLLNDLLLMSC